jgi:hypothetical protein
MPEILSTTCLSCPRPVAAMLADKLLVTVAPGDYLRRLC